MADTAVLGTVAKAYGFKSLIPHHRSKMSTVRINKMLTEKFPFLKPDIKDYDYTWNMIEDFIPMGWWIRFGVPLCQDLVQVCQDENIDPKNIKVLEAKEKYGELRLYLNEEPEGWHIHDAAWEYISEYTCISCGNFPAPMRNDGWLYSCCNECFKGIKKEIKVVEFLKLNVYENGSYHNVIIDMKPYYEKIGMNVESMTLIKEEE